MPRPRRRTLRLRAPGLSCRLERVRYWMGSPVGMEAGVMEERGRRDVNISDVVREESVGVGLWEA